MFFVQCFNQTFLFRFFFFLKIGEITLREGYEPKLTTTSTGNKF